MADNFRNSDTAIFIFMIPRIFLLEIRIIDFKDIKKIKSILLNINSIYFFLYSCQFTNDYLKLKK